MQVKICTVIETIVEIDPENTDDFECAKREIFNRYVKSEDHPKGVEETRAAQASAVVHDTILRSRVRHSFTEVK